MSSSLGGLWAATRDLHHRAEGHPVAKRMVDGTITAQEWADWLHALWAIHAALDPHLPLCARRADAFAADMLALLPVTPRQSEAAARYAATLTDIPSIFGAAYITIGAHRRGGRVIEKAMKAQDLDLPHRHIVFDQPQEVERLIGTWRECTALADGARRAFQALYDVMDEIEARAPVVASEGVENV